MTDEKKGSPSLAYPQFQSQPQPRPQHQSLPPRYPGAQNMTNSTPSTRPASGQSQYYQPDNTPTSNFCYDQQKNKPQSNSVAGALMVMLVSGIHISWGVTTPFIRLQQWHWTADTAMYTMVIISWYLGAISGSVINYFIYTKFTKRQIYYMACGLCVISSALFMALGQEPIALIVVRFVAGIAHGIAYVTGICHASENSVKDYRGFLLSCFHYLILCSIFCVSFIIPLEPFNQNGIDINFNMIVGGLALVYSVMGIAFIPCLTFESVVYLIQRQQYSQAIQNMIKLRNESTESWEIKNDFDEMKLMVAEDLRTSPSILKDGNERPFVLILLCKFVVALGFNYALNMIRVTALAGVIDETYVAGTMYAIRFMIVTICIFMVDIYGRKKLFTFSTTIAGCALLLYGILYLTVDDAVAQSLPIFLFEVVCGMGMLHIPDVLMSEAFPITKKILSMTIASVMELILQIVIIAITYSVQIKDYAVPLVFTFGSLLIITAAFLCRELPETRVMSLRQARSEFRKTNDDTTFNREQLPANINNYS